MSQPLDRKSLASFRILVAVARADGKLEDHEVESLKGALGKNSDMLPALLEEDVTIEDELQMLSEAERSRVYESAFALAYSDGAASVDEVNVLRRIVPNKGEEGILGQVFGEVSDTLMPNRIVAEADPAKRDMEITEDILKYSVLSAVAGAMPVPGVAIVADLAVIALQAKMVHDIGQYWGHAMDQKAISAFMGSVMGSAGMRIAVNNVARLIPGWGSAFGAATSFATTYALGRVAQRYFTEGREFDDTELKDLFSRAKDEGRSRFTSEEQRIARAREAHGERLAELNDALASGAMTRAEYDAAVAKLPR